MAVRNLKTSQRKKQKDAIRRSQTASPTGFASITRGQFRIASDEGLLVQGSQRVTGRLNIDGIEIVDGQLLVNGSFVLAGNADFTGPVAIRGVLRIEGDTWMVGPVRIEGDLDLSGKTIMTGDLDLLGNLRVKADGTITVEGTTDMQIGRLANGHAGIDFGTAELYSDGNYLAMTAGDSTSGVTPTFAQISHSGNGFRATADGPQLGGVKRATEGQTLYAVLMDGDGNLVRARDAFTTDPGDDGGDPPISKA